VPGGAPALRSGVVTEHGDIGSTAVDLRREFDLAFASAPSEAIGQTQDLLALRIAGDHYALRLRDVAGLVTGKKIVALPTRTPELLGIVGIRGRLVCVYSLEALLGYGPSAEQPPWLVLCRTDETVAFAFHECQGSFRISSSDVCVASEPDVARRHVREVARAGVVRAIVNVQSLMDTLKRRGGGADPKE
jgi:purine-binding chemotaxis protein CheW